jgi:hypothetical protein
MPPPSGYLNFDMEIQRRASGYAARVLDSPGGQGSAEFQLPFSDLEIENLLLKMGFERGRVRGRDRTKLEAAKQFGGKLFATVFVGEVARCWQTSLEKAAGSGLRIRLRLSDAPELADLPWEFLYDRTFDNFLNHSVETPLVRYLDLPSPPRPLAVEPPLNILVVISLPKDWEPLEADREWENMQRELAPLVERGAIMLERAEQATLGALQRKLRDKSYHILHFVGHGEYVEAMQENVLLLEDAQGQSRRVDGNALGTLLLGHRSMRLVILNACEGARANRSDPFGGVAQKLIQMGIPAVVAMQFAISDVAALKLSSEFYSALADNYPIDAALAEARRAIFLDDNAVEWATPVLYSRAPDGVIFNVNPLPEMPVRPSTPPSRAESEPAHAETTRGPAEASFDALYKRARALQTEGEQILDETPNERDLAIRKFQEASALFYKADEMQPDDPRVAFHMGEIWAHIYPDDLEDAREQFRRAERLLTDATDADSRRLLARTLLARALLTDPPNEKLLMRAGELADALNDTILLGRIEQAVDRVASSGTDTFGKPSTEAKGTEQFSFDGWRPDPAAAAERHNVHDPNWRPPAPDDFNPVGRWNIQVQDMVGSRLFVEFAANGSFQMLQQVGMYQVPVNGSWMFNPQTRQLALQGVINTFQPFILAITIHSAIPNGYAGMGSDGIGYVLTRV